MVCAPGRAGVPVGSTVAASLAHPLASVFTICAVPTILATSALSLLFTVTDTSRSGTITTVTVRPSETCSVPVCAAWPLMVVGCSAGNGFGSRTVAESKATTSTAGGLPSKHIGTAPPPITTVSAMGVPQSVWFAFQASGT